MNQEAVHKAADRAWIAAAVELIDAWVGDNAELRDEERTIRLPVHVVETTNRIARELVRWKWNLALSPLSRDTRNIERPAFL